MRPPAANVAAPVPPLLTVSVPVKYVALLRLRTLEVTRPVPLLESTPPLPALVSELLVRVPVIVVFCLRPMDVAFVVPMFKAPVAVASKLAP